MHGHDRTEMKTVESFENHSILLLPFCFTRTLTEENKKPEPCRQHFTMSFKIKYQNQYPETWIIPKEIKLYQKKIPQNLGIAEEGTPKSKAPPEKVPKIIAYLRTSRCMQVTLSDFLALLG